MEIDDDLKNLARTARDSFFSGFRQLSAEAKKKAFFLALSQFNALLKKIDLVLKAELGEVALKNGMNSKLGDLLIGDVYDFRRSYDIIRYLLHAEVAMHGVYQIDRDRLKPLLRLHDEVYSALLPYWNANKEEVNRTDESARDVMTNTMPLGLLLK